MKTILIISHSHDCHVVKMVDELAQLNWPFFVLYLDLFTRDYQLTQCVSNSVTKAVLKNNLTGEFVDFSDIGVVWNRKPAPFSFKESEIRFCISLAALLVNVTQRIWFGQAFFCFIICTTLEVKSFVFPDPAPATIRQGTSGFNIASF